VRECRVFPGVLVVTRVRSITTIAHETAGAAGTRHSPRPPWGREINARLGRIAPRDHEVMFGTGADTVIASEAKAIHLAAQRKNGLLRFARNDGSTTETSWLFEN
jgi:hypothetical protein